MHAQLFPEVLVDETLLAAAYSAESVLIEIIFIVGPLIVALFVALASPALAVAAGGVLRESLPAQAALAAGTGAALLAAVAARFLLGR